MEREEDEKPKRKPCHICHGNSYIERPNGETFDCPNRACEYGYITIKEQK